ncbi:MAG: hypothetical protein QOE06_563 [Thermoleophilaceae bacterium]|jgi:HEAT repeat protein|nr:hypothetical protein [Thermoleophilaceae bacterium]
MQDLVESTDGQLVDLAVSVRRDALRALGELPGDALAAEDATEVVMEGLRDNEEDVAVAAVDMLSASESPESYPILVIAVAAVLPAAGHNRARMRAAERLAVYGPDAAADLARALVEREDGTALGADDADTLSDLLERATGSPHPTPEVTRTLVDGMRSSRMAERERAQQALGWYAEFSVEPLLVALEDPELRPGAATVLGSARDVRAVPQLAECLSDPDVETRRAAARSLGELTSPRAVEPLLRATDDDDFRVRSEAVAALDRLGTVGVVVGIETLARKGTPRIEQAEEYTRTLQPPPPVEVEARTRHVEPATPAAASHPQAQRAVTPRAETPAEEPAEREVPAIVDEAERSEPSVPVARDGGALWPGLRRVLDAGREARWREEAGSPGR